MAVECWVFFAATLCETSKLNRCIQILKTMIKCVISRESHYGDHYANDSDDDSIIMMIHIIRPVQPQPKSEPKLVIMYLHTAHCC